MNCQNCQYWNQRTIYKEANNRWDSLDNSLVRDRIIKDSTTQSTNSEFGICEKEVVYINYCNNGEHGQFELDNTDKTDYILIYPYEPSGIEIVTGKDFGCIHFEDKNEL